MKNFDEIIANIQKELLELKEINLSLREENASLREQLGMPASNDNDELSLEEAFSNFLFRDYTDTRGKKIGAYSCLIRAGFRNIGDLRNKSIHDLLRIRGAGASTCAIWIILLEQYGIHIDLPDLESITSIVEYQAIKEIYEELPKLRESMVFLK
jgi:DNA-directed RNA polymerase alpha subunit